MTEGAKALLSGIIDYAGLFPPAALDMKSAVTGFDRHRRDPDAWMLKRFVCPVVRLDEFELHATPLIADSQEPWSLTVLGQGGPDATSFLKGLWQDMTRVPAFQERHAPRARIDALEVALPRRVLESEDPEAMERLIEGALEVVASQPAGIGSIFLEIPLGPNAEASVKRTFQALRALRETRPPVELGAKIRTGGQSAAAVPEPEVVAEFIVFARDHGVPFKATAGLHHPVRRFAPLLGTEQHGFMNVFGGAVLAACRKLDERALLAVLLEEDPSQFRVDSTGFGWRREWATVDEIAAARSTLAVSFGSCSFEEPRDDLRAMRLL